MTAPLRPAFNMPNNSFLSKYQVNLPNVIAAMAKSQPTGLPEKYQVGPNDVVCGRGKGSYNRPGNKRFRAMVQEHVDEYVQAKTKLDKSMVLSAIVEKVREQWHGRFVKQKKGAWEEIGDEQAREKVGHAIREAIAAGEKKTTISPTVASVAAPQKMIPDISSDFSAKQTHLLSVQASIFQGLVRSTPPANGASGTAPQPVIHGSTYQL
mmetsp:Transcript_10215/g.19606  ORF Transcript_10215/g.19606 Transcript_10215/m.19606 type:complete len:209 (-) Transcript_10215:65-691(-)|eukprot:scaffold7168_cov182-Amphora_coffeaeformis.AAC.7